MRRLAVVALLAATLAGARSVDAFVVPTWGQGLPEIVGEYVDTGTDLDDAPGDPNVTAVITKESEGLYRIVETGPAGVYECLCIRTEMHLGCGWARKGSTISVASYRFQGGKLEGKVFVEGSPSLVWGHEKYVANAALNGDFTASNAETQDALPYTALIEARPVPGSTILSYVRSSRFFPGNAPYLYLLGYGLRTEGFVDIGLATGGGGVGTIEYTIEPGGRVIHGRWMDSGRPYGGTGLDILTRV